MRATGISRRKDFPPIASTHVEIHGVGTTSFSALGVGYTTNSGSFASNGPKRVTRQEAKSTCHVVEHSPDRRRCTLGKGRT